MGPQHPDHRLQDSLARCLRQVIPQFGQLYRSSIRARGGTLLMDFDMVLLLEILALLTYATVPA